MSSFEPPIPSTPSDDLLQSWGYDLREEYCQIAQGAALHPGAHVLEVASGTGRMTALLTRLGCSVTTGDVTQEKAEQLWQRVTPAYAHQVRLMLFDLRGLPFKTGSVGTVVCLNTLHELAEPRRSLEELLRVHDRSGTLVIGDFNETGFETMQKLHQAIYGNDHPLGSMKISEVEPILRRHYVDVKVVLTPLNISFIASGKASETSAINNC
ncbi:MAG: class SAM-dependent methyltransferase [Bacteroidetes bacterium]|nr:class SAM-dependent methyltransferase [Bacteroidota bacterium]